MDRVDVLEQKIMKSGQIDQSGYVVPALREFQIDMLNKLRHLRDTMDNDLSCGTKNEDLIRENEELKGRVIKLEYRISHLLRHIPASESTGRQGV